MKGSEVFNGLVPHIKVVVVIVNTNWLLLYAGAKLKKTIGGVQIPQFADKNRKYDDIIEV